MPEGSGDEKKRSGDVVRFPFARVAPKKSERARDLGLTPLSKLAPAVGRAPLGHWCGRCEGIWYSYFLEAQCPVCGRRG